MPPLSPAISLIALGFFLMSTPPIVVVDLSEFGGEGYGPGALRPKGVWGGGLVPTNPKDIAVAEEDEVGNIVCRRIREDPCIGREGPV
jgi:hypothetical protein